MNKYKTLKIDGKCIAEHRYVMEQHLGRKLRRNEVVHHIDGDKSNNSLSNLELMSYKEHNDLHGHTERAKEILRTAERVYVRGEKTGSSKLTEELVISLREEFRDSRKGIRARARQLGINHMTLAAALDRKTWKHI